MEHLCHSNFVSVSVFVFFFFTNLSCMLLSQKSFVSVSVFVFLQVCLAWKTISCLTDKGNRLKQVKFSQGVPVWRMEVPRTGRHSMLRTCHSSLLQNVLDTSELSSVDLIDLKPQNAVMFTVHCNVQCFVFL